MLYPRMLVNLLPMTKSRINAMLCQERPCDMDWHLLRLTLTILLTSQIANSFGRPHSQVTVSTIFSLLKPPPTVLISFVRGNTHTCFPLFNIRSLKTHVNCCLFKYGMYNPLIIILCFFSLVRIPCFMLCVSYFVYFIDIHFVTVGDCHTE